MSQCADLHPPKSCAGEWWSNDTVVGFRPEPNCGRGTAGIIWTCLTIMFFSAWSVIHLDTKPFPSSFSFQSLPHKLMLLLRQKWTKNQEVNTVEYQPVPYLGPVPRKIIEAAIILMFPEYGVLKAVEELTVARLIQHRIREIDGWENFTLKQAHLVRMGGINIPQIQRPEHFPSFILQNSYIMEYDCFPKDAWIDLRSKRDFVDKLILLSQTVYFLSTTAIRNTRFYRLAVIEAFTLNYIGYASITFLLRLHKPQELYEGFELEFTQLPTPSILFKPDEIQHPRLELWTWIGTFCSIVVVNLVPFLVLRKRDSNLPTKNSIIAIVGMFFTFLFLLRRRLENHPWKRNTTFRSITWYVCVIFMYLGSFVYAAYRIRLWFVVFMEFSIAPEGIYYVPSSWTRYLGHVGA